MDVHHSDNSLNLAVSQCNFYSDQVIINFLLSLFVQNQSKPQLIPDPHSTEQGSFIRQGTVSHEYNTNTVSLSKDLKHFQSYTQHFMSQFIT